MLEDLRVSFYAIRMSELLINYTRMSEILGEALRDDDPVFYTPASMRLRMEYCSVTTVAISNYFNSIGYNARPLISRPQLSGDRGMEHAFTRVEGPTGPLIVDATYSQFMGYVGVGLRPFEDEYYPKERVVEFAYGDVGQIVDPLIECTRLFRQAIEDKKAAPLLVSSILRLRSEEEVRVTLEKIWDPKYISDYIPVHAPTIEAGNRFAEILRRAMPPLEKNP